MAIVSTGGWFAQFDDEAQSEQQSDGGRRFPEDTAPLAVWVEDRGNISARIVDPEDGRLCDPEQFANFVGFQKTPTGEAGRL